MRAVAFALLLLTAGLAGCLGGGGTDGGDRSASEPGMPDTDGPDESDQSDAGTDALEASLRFAQDDPISEVRWENGTFQVTEHSHPKGVVTQHVGSYDPDRREIDLTRLVPQDMPVVLTAEVNADLGEGDVDIWFEMPSGEIWNGESDTPYGGYSRIEATVLHTSSNPITLVLRYDEIDDSPEFDYTLRYSVSYEPGRVPAGVPVGVDVPEQATALRVEFDDEREDRGVLIWDPEDTLVGRFDPGDERVTLPLDEEAPRGEYVVLLAEGSGSAQISLLGADEDPAPLRALLQEIVFGERQQAQGGESELAWSFETDRVPVQAAILWWSSEVSQNTHASLSSPAGEILGADWTYDPRVDGMSFVLITEVGVPNLTTGTYQAQVSFDENAGPSPMEATHALVFYDRGR